MTKYALVKNNIVVNVIEWDGKTLWGAPKDCEAVLLKDNVMIGSTFNGINFIPPVITWPSE